MPTLATLTGGDRPADTRTRPAAAAPAPRACVRPQGMASVSIPSVGVTVSFTPNALKAASGLAHSAVKLGASGAELIGDAAQVASDIAGNAVNSGVKAAIIGGALLGLL